MKRIVALLSLVLLYSSLSQAAVTNYVFDSGGDAVATVSGTIDTTGFGSPTQATVGSSFLSGPGSGGNPSLDGSILVGSQTAIDYYSIDSSLVFNTGGPLAASSLIEPCYISRM